MGPGFVVFISLLALVYAYDKLGKQYNKHLGKYQDYYDDLDESLHDT